ncbi:DUF4179 domain-containing protein [Paenibacillus sp. GCM10012306]|uniref:DUF4179 domain-containing protein n=1 Tax=Paenibacillus sp. GCM10012306 TaxID=3317342 RepID=UPI00361B8EE0
MSQYIQKDKHVPQPNYDSMWTAIEKEAHKRQVNLQPPQNTPRNRMKLVPISIAFSCFLLVGIPVFAGVTINWNKIGGLGVTTALNNGIGQQYDLKASSSGVTMNLNGVVSDGEKMKMLLSLDTNTDLSHYIGFATEKNTITSESGAKAKVCGYLEYDSDSHKLIGIYETPDTLKDAKKDYKFEAQNLIFYRNRDIPLKSNLQAGDTIVTGATQYPTIHIVSVRQAANQTIIRYRVAASPSDSGRGNPHLVISIGGQEKDAIPTLMPSEGPDLLLEQVFDMTEPDWKDAGLHLSYIEEARRISGTWAFDFQADGKKASESIYTKALHTSPEFQEKTGVTLDQLVVTPLEIQILIDEEESLPKGIVHYKTAQLVIGDTTITGGWNLRGDNPESYQHLFQFESPEWYKNWSDVPMKLLLKDAVIEKRDPSKNWITLNKPAKEKQFTKLDVDGFEIQFAYYTEGGKLIVESSSKSPGFKGVNQTTLRINGKEVVPEITPKGMISTGTNIDSYTDIPFDRKIELNPGIYKYSDPSRDVEIKL